MSKKRVEKMKKSKHVRATPIPDKRHLPGMLYRPLDQRKTGNGDSDAVLRNRKRRLSHSDEMNYDFNDYPSSEYQRMFET